MKLGTLTIRLPLLLALATMLTGCSTWRLPAIDPSGRNIFLPPPTYTSVDLGGQTPGVHPLLERIRLEPAFRDAPDPECVLPPILPNPQPQADPVEPGTPVEPASPRVVVPGQLGSLAAADGPLYGCPDKRQANPRDRVVLSPRRQVAPVGSEVILLGGVCGADGFYTTRESLEWAIGQGSVGHFVEPGVPSVGWLGLRGSLATWLAEPLPELLSNNYALGRTSKRVQVLTRGTAAPNDDVFVLEGQTWIGVTSANEGDTYVTLMAPELDAWKQRKRMAVIHWVDGKWTVPTTLVAQSMQPQSITTNVRRQISDAPVAGWTVRYEIVSGVPATFADGTTVAEVTTDSLGQATVELVPGGQGGTTRVKATVIRPAHATSGTQQLVLGEGFTTVIWSTPEIRLQVSGPQSVRTQEQIRYVIEVTNAGTVDASDVLVQAATPAGFRYLSSQPTAQLAGDQLQWSLGPLQAGQQVSLQAVYQAERGGQAQYCAAATAAGAAPVQSCATTRITSEALYIEMLGPNPEVPVDVGQTAEYRVTVTNRGTTQLSNVLLIDRFDDGLEHQQGESPIEWPLGTLQAGQSRQIGLSFRIARAGRHCHTLQATATESQPASATACITARPPARPDLTIRKTGPTQMIAGERADFYVLLENTGETTLSNIRVSDQYDSEFRIVRTDPEAQNTGGNRVTWYLSRLEPGQQYSMQVQCEALSEANSACSRAVVETVEGLQRADEICVPILPDATGSATNAGQPRNSNARNNSPTDNNATDMESTVPRIDSQPRTTNGTLQPYNAPRGAAGPSDSASLELSIDGRGQRWQVGDRIEYMVVITNNQQLPDSDVQLSLRLPPELALESYSGPVSAAENSADWRSVTMTPIRTLRSGESIEFSIIASVLSPGEIVTTAQVTSARVTDPIRRSDSAMARP